MEKDSAKGGYQTIQKNTIDHKGNHLLVKYVNALCDGNSLLHE
jgi:hypothetical protein